MQEGNNSRNEEQEIKKYHESTLIFSVPFKDLNIINGIQSLSRATLFRPSPENEEYGKEIENSFKMLQIHLGEIQIIETILSRRTQFLGNLSSLIKIFVIVLGALVVTKEVANQLLGASNAINIVLYTIIGLLITSLTGLEASFKWGNRSIALRNLAVESRKMNRKVSSEIVNISANKDNKGKLKDLQDALKELDDYIGDIQNKAAENGINIIAEIQKKYPLTDKSDKNE